ncbi:MAG TPA: 2Fe-2S iron-sulfur cluster-binding protein [Gemmatimonadaceae bacterium]|jgi:xanthine dehydrogenase YagT iron-sulfur-binding subunit
MRSLIDREPVAPCAAGDVIEPGDAAPDFELTSGTGRLRLSDFRGSPVVIAFHGAHWDPARAEYIETYNRLVASLGGVAGARLLEIGGGDPWRSLTFSDGAISLPVLSSSDASIARRFGAGSESAVFVIDADGIVRWSQVGPISLANPVEVARAISAVAAPFVAEPNDNDYGDGHKCAHDLSWTRRDFVATTLAAAFALVLRPLEAHAERAAALNAERSTLNAQSVTLNVNGRDLTLDVEPRVTLLDALREYAGLTGTKKGCDHGQCGACTVHVDGRRELSCMTFAVMQEGHRITTIEGLASGERLHPMQQAFITHDGFQCGYCTSGQIMSAVGVLDEPWGPGDDDVREAMSGNICRCGAYPGIVAAVQEVRRAQASNGGGRTQ